jgi:hypothetical protein
MPATVNITVENDADFYRMFQCQTAAGAPINITGWLMWMMLRRHAQDDTAMMRLGTDTGEIVIVDAVNGKWSMFIAQDDLQRLALGNYDHSLIAEVNNIKSPIWNGTFINNPGPSR